MRYLDPRAASGCRGSCCDAIDISFSFHFCEILTPAGCIHSCARLCPHILALHSMLHICLPSIASSDGVLLCFCNSAIGCWLPTSSILRLLTWLLCGLTGTLAAILFNQWVKTVSFLTSFPLRMHPHRYSLGQQTFFFQ